jgi:hypothetical protein
VQLPERARTRDFWLGAGACVLAACAWGCFSVGGERLAAQAAVSGASGGYRLVPASEGWRRAQPEADEGGGSPDLKLVYGDGIELVVWIHGSSGSSIDEIVDSRRSIAAEAFEVTTYVESRNFLDEHAATPASLAIYGGRAMGLPLALQVLTVDDGSRIYELVGTSVSQGGAEALNALIMSFALGAEDEP